MLQFRIMHAISRAARSQQLNTWALHDSNARHAPPSATVSRRRLHSCGNLGREEYQTKSANALLEERLKRKQPAASS